jgi:hypothetical protein
MTASVETRLANLAQSALRDLADWAGIENISLDQVLYIMNQSGTRPYYLNELSYGGYHEVSEYGLDTCVRERIMNDVAMYYTGSAWPTYVDYVDVKAFRENLVAAIAEKG